MGIRGAIALATAVFATGCATALEDPNWIEVQTEHFRLFSNAPVEKSVAIAKRLEVFREVARQTTNFRRFDERVPTYVYLFENGSSFHDFSLGRSVVGYLAATSHATYMAFNAGHSRADPLEVLQHEYTHYLQYNQSQFNYPPWYTEGLAELLSTVRVTDDAVELGRVPMRRMSFVAQGSQLGYWHPIRRVMRTRSLANWPDIQIGMFYGQAWALTHFLHASHLVGFPNRLSRMQAYLARLNQGLSHDEAFKATFDVSEAQLERELIRYLNRSLPFLGMARMPFDVAATPAVRSLEPERRLLHLGDLALQFTLDEEPDRSKAATARKAFREAIQMKPGLALAHAGLALALRAGEHADGDAAVERALELAPDDALVCLYAAEYFLPPRGSDAPVDRKRLKRARELIHRGLELAPDLPALHLALGRSFLLDGQDPAQAVAPLERSQELLRWDMEGALALGEAYLRTGARERARVTLTRVVNGTHDDRQRKRANELLGEFGEAATAEGTEE